MSRFLTSNLIESSTNINLDFSNAQQTSYLVNKYNSLYVQKPTITTVTHPTTGSVSSGDTVANLQGCTYTSDAYATVSDGTLVGSQWQLSLFANFSTVLWDMRLVANTLSTLYTSVTFNEAAFNNGVLPTGTTQYNVRVRYINSLGFVSEFSPIFTLNI